MVLLKGCPLKAYNVHGYNVQSVQCTLYKQVGCLDYTVVTMFADK